MSDCAYPICDCDASTPCRVARVTTSTVPVCHGCNGAGFHYSTCKHAPKHNPIATAPDSVNSLCVLCNTPGMRGEPHPCIYAASVNKPDPVNHPPHYTAGAVECIDAIESALGADGFAAYCRGQVVKYLWRAGKKDDTLQDAKKAQWYVNRLVQTLEKP